MSGVLAGKLFGMTAAGSVMILLTLILRPLFKQLPKRYFCVLWLFAMVRLLWPFTFASPASLLPVNPEPLVQAEYGGNTVTYLDTGISAIDRRVNVMLVPSAAQGEAAGYAAFLQTLPGIFTAVWLAGLALFLGFHGFRYIKLMRQLKCAVPGDGGAYYAEELASPVTAGLIRPKIFLPEYLLSGEYKAEREMILAHERAHIRRGDPLWKAFSFLALSVHWFNPLVWLMFVLFGRDLEMACDEAVIGTLGENRKKEYSMTLLRFSARRSGLGLPLAFGESSTESRIRNILKYSRPKKWICLAAVLLLGAAAVTLLTDPLRPEQEGAGSMTGEKANVSIIGGADGPTSIFLAGKTDGTGDEGISIIGGADGPTAIFVAGKVGDGGEEDGGPAAHIDLEAAGDTPIGEYAELDYVSAGKIALHGSFGYLSFQMTEGAGEPGAELLSAVTLEETGGLVMAGDAYTGVFAGESGTIIIPEIYSETPAEKALYIYDEAQDRVYEVSQVSGDMLETMTQISDAPAQLELYHELLELFLSEESGRIYYGPTEIAEYDTNTYGFLAADGENLSSLWYGIWNRDLEEIRKIPLFSE